MYLPTNRQAVHGSLAVFAASCALFATQIWIEYDYYHEHGWEMARGLRLDAFLNGIFSPWLPATLSFVLLILIAVSIFAWPRLGRAWWYAVMPMVALITTLLVRLVVPVFYLWNVV